MDFCCVYCEPRVKLQKIKGDLEKISVNRLYEDCDVKLDIPETAMAGTYMHSLKPHTH